MTKIEWAQDVWNPVVGCTIVDHRCTHCYAMRDAYRKQFNPNAKIRSAYDGTVKMANGFPVWTGKVNLLPERLDVPLRRRKPTTYFVDSMSDLFHVNVPDEFLDRVFATMAACDRHRFIVLTKRVERMAKSIPGDIRKAADRLEDHVERLIDDNAALANWPLPNVILGTSASDQATFDAAAPHMRRLAAAGWNTVWSLEPLLGPIDVSAAVSDREPTKEQINSARGMHYIRHGAPWASWVIVGSESGPGARPMNEDWVRDIRDQCVAAGVPFFYKQNTVNGKKIGTPLLDEMRWNELSEVLR